LNSEIHGKRLSKLTAKNNMLQAGKYNGSNQAMLCSYCRAD
jgi:hypothetical protein